MHQYANSVVINVRGAIHPILAVAFHVGRGYTLMAIPVCNALQAVRPVPIASCALVVVMAI